jgi:hypothetical protein
MAGIRRLAAAGACAAAFCLAATPAAAVELPRAHAVSAAHEGDYAENYRYRRYRDRDRTGDVLAGVLILGTIAAVASAANSNRQRDYERRAPYPREDYRYRSDYRTDGRGLDRAVGMCVDEIERVRDRVGSVDGANRTGEGWTVSGALEGGAGFTCRIDNMGRIRAVEIGGAYSGYEGSQYDDEVYARARLSHSGYEPGVAPGEEDDRPIWTGD